VGRVAFKRRLTPLDGNHVLALSSCIVSFHLPSPRMGSARVAFVLSSLEERNFTEVGSFQPSLGFKDFHQAAGRGFSVDEVVGASRRLTSGSTALVACPRPSSGVVGDGLVAATSALRSSLLLFGRPERRSLSLLPERAAVSHLRFCRPAGPPMWGVVRTRGGGTGVPFVMAP
jgi:hypothetical protein